MRSNHSWLLVTLIVSVASIGRGTPHPYSDGLEALKSGNYRNAYRLLSEVDPVRDHTVYFLLGIVNEKLSQYQEASQNFTFLLKQINPSDEMYWPTVAHKAYTESIVGNWVTATNLIESIPPVAIDRTVGLVLASAELSVGMKGRKEYYPYLEKALHQYEAISASGYQDDSVALNGIGRAYLAISEFKKGDEESEALAQACNYFSRAIAIKPRPVFLNNLGVVETRLKDWKAAERFFDLAERGSRDSDEAHKHAVENQSYLRRKQKEDPHAQPRWNGDCTQMAGVKIEPVGLTSSVAGMAVSKSAASLAVSVAAPISVLAGHAFTVVATVTNTGEISATLLTASLDPSSTEVVLVAGPTQLLPLVLNGGSAVSLVWTFSAKRVGFVTYT